MGAYNTIKKTKYVDIIVEAAATEAISPGMLVEIVAANTVKKHASAGQNVLPMVALEDELQGKGVDDDYASGDKVQVWIPRRGDIAALLLAVGENIAVGDFLESDGAGAVAKHTASSAGAAEYPASIVGQALEAKDLSTSGAVATLVLVRIL